ncbi:hypothetical protein MKW92_045509 [Papaver armeniacum]|nr:hypothetical protein MKW92_045509 [Papaver armeniacum]
MAKKNIFILCLFLVLLIFCAGCKAKTCKETWVTSCVMETDCADKCLRDHGKEGQPLCYVGQREGEKDMCYCEYDC